jgi:hypothetical protein
MKEVRNLTIFTCDDPECDGQAIVDIEIDGLPEGYHGTVTHISSSGGTGAEEWFACRGVHIRPAILTAIENSLRQE